MFKPQIKKMKQYSLDKLLKYSLYKRLIWCFVVMFILPILLIGGFNAMDSLTKNQKEAKVFLEESSTQIANNISYYLLYHMNLLDEVAQNPQIVDAIANYEHVEWKRKSEIENNIRLVLGHTFGASSAINTFELISRNHSYFYYPSPVSNGDFSKSNLLSLNAVNVQMTLGTKEIPNDETNHVILTRGIFNEKQECIGNIVVALDLTYFNKACYENVGNLLNEVMILDANQVIVSASNDALVGNVFKGDQDGSISTSKHILSTDLTIVNTIPMKTLLRSALTLFSITLFITVVFAILAFYLALMLTKSVTRPINRLMKEMNRSQVEKYVEDDGDDEYHLIIESFNLMNSHIVQAIQSQYEHQLQEMELRELRKEAELSALQQQINPHFLYNTLESIYWYGQLEGDEEISEIVNALGQYLRMIIDKGREYVKVSDEFENVSNYLFLQNKRFGDRIHFRYEMPQSIREKHILKLTLQPVVEDIITANLDAIETDIDLNAMFDIEDKRFIIKLTGEAVHYFLSVLQEIELEMHGINSVDERLALYYGPSYGVDIGTSNKEINIVLPVENHAGSR